MTSATSLPATAEQDVPLRRSLRMAVGEGVVRIMGHSLCEGVFLAGFAAALGADERAAGLIGAMPGIGEALQLLGAHVIQRAGSRRRVFVAANVLTAAVWAMVAAGAFVVSPGRATVWAFVACCAVNAFLGSARYLAWLDWFRDLVPPRLRGRYFARRNRLVLLAGMALSIPAAWLVDRYRGAHPDLALRPYGFVFALAAGLIGASVLFARRVHEPPMHRAEGGLWRTALRTVWRSGPFRRYFVFRLFMNFAIGLSGPLLTFYLVRELEYSRTFIAGLDVLATLVSAGTLLLWGKLADRVGNRPAMVLIYGIKLLWAALWVFVGRESYALLVVIYVLSAHGSGSVLLHQNLLMKLVPRAGAAASLSLFNAVTAAGSAVGPIVGGFLLHTLLPPQVRLLGGSMSNWQALILISVGVRFLCTLGLIGLREPASMGLRHFARWMWRAFLPEQHIATARLPAEEDGDEDAPADPAAADRGAPTESGAGRLA